MEFFSGTNMYKSSNQVVTSHFIGLKMTDVELKWCSSVRFSKFQPALQII